MPGWLLTVSRYGMPDHSYCVKQVHRIDKIPLRLFTIYYHDRHDNYLSYYFYHHTGGRTVTGVADGLAAQLLQKAAGALSPLAVAGGRLCSLKIKHLFEELRFPPPGRPGHQVIHTYVVRILNTSGAQASIY